MPPRLHLISLLSAFLASEMSIAENKNCAAETDWGWTCTWPRHRRLNLTSGLTSWFSWKKKRKREVFGLKLHVVVPLWPGSKHTNTQQQLYLHQTGELLRGDLMWLRLRPLLRHIQVSCISFRSIKKENKGESMALVCERSLFFFLLGMWVLTCDSARSNHEKKKKTPFVFDFVQPAHESSRVFFSPHQPSLSALSIFLLSNRCRWLIKSFCIVSIKDILKCSGFLSPPSATAKSFYPEKIYISSLSDVRCKKEMK